MFECCWTAAQVNNYKERQHKALNSTRNSNTRKVSPRNRIIDDHTCRKNTYDWKNMKVAMDLFPKSNRQKSDRAMCLEGLTPMRSRAWPKKYRNHVFKKNMCTDPPIWIKT